MKQSFGRRTNETRSKETGRDLLHLAEVLETLFFRDHCGGVRAIPAHAVLDPPLANRTLRSKPRFRRWCRSFGLWRESSSQMKRNLQPQLLRCLAPPYSEPFHHATLRIFRLCVQENGVTATTILSSSSGYCPSLDIFLRASACTRPKRGALMFVIVVLLGHLSERGSVDLTVK